MLDSEIMIKRILVTGAGGYIGRHVVHQLLEAGQQVIAADIKLNDIDDRAEKIETNIFSGDPNLYTNLGSPDVCLHMAWRDGFKHNSSTHLEDLSKHYVFIQNMIQDGLRHIAVMGTMHEVGYWEGPITETTPCNPASLYGIAKNALREATLLLAQNNDVVAQWIRAYYIVGDDARGNSIFAKLLQAAQNGQETFPFTTGKNKYDFIDLDELARQISAVVSQEQVNGIINCCSGEPVSLADRVEQYIRDHKLNIKLDYGAFPDRPYDSPEVWGDASKIREILGI